MVVDLRDQQVTTTCTVTWFYPGSPASAVWTALELRGAPERARVREQVGSDVQ